MTQINPATQAAVLAVFLLFVAATVTGALLAVLTPKIIHGVCGLALCCTGLAGLYYFLCSPFLALMEMLIYVGAVCITIIFAVMLAEPMEPPPPERTLASFGWGGLAFAITGAAFAGLCWVGASHAWPKSTASVDSGSIAAIGTSLLTTYSLAFELISLVLLVAILGALVIARYGRTKP